MGVTGATVGIDQSSQVGLQRVGSSPETDAVAEVGIDQSSQVGLRPISAVEHAQTTARIAVGIDQSSQVGLPTRPQPSIGSVSTAADRKM